MERSETSPNRAVVWLSPGASAPAGLLGALGHKGLDVTLVVDAAAALREVIRTGARRVVLCEPGELPRTDELIDTLRAYYPDTVCWRFDASENPADPDGSTGGTLSTVNGHLVGPSEQAARVSSSPRAADPDRDADSLDLPTRLVTEEEVTMLLGPGEPEEPSGSAEDAS